MTERMTIGDEGGSGPKTSIKMTRAMGEGIGWIALDILKEIEAGTINLSYTQWEWFIANFWFDDTWKKVLSKVINKSRTNKPKLDLNKNGYFLDFIFENVAIELHNEAKKGAHPIFRQSLMELVTKEKPKKKQPKTIKDLWP